MKAFHLLGLPPHLYTGVQGMLKRQNNTLCESGMPVFISVGDTLRVFLHDGQAEISCPEHLLFRGLGILLQNLDQEEYLLEERPRFQHLGVHLDMSRNGIMRVSALKDYMDTLALMGYDQVYLYLEDMFEMPQRPYFGYLRGRYTAAELQELDDHAYSIGIELIPSIQALGHHEQYLRWQEADSIRDTPEVLLADSAETYAFIEQMIRTVTASLRSKKIMLGMDETHTLGLGTHLRRFGYEPPKDIFLRHLKQVFAITDKLGLEGMIASDMFFRMCAPDGWYYTEETVITPEIAQSIPPNATLVYWHYGETPGCDDYMLEKHRALNRKTVFFGGTWTWSGHLPNTDYAIQVTEEALEACEKHSICDVIQTIWGDDGNECNHLYALLTLQYTAEYAFGHNGDNRWLAQQFRACTGADADAFHEMSAYQCSLDQGTAYADFKERFRGKTLFWQDVLLGQADEYLSKVPMSGWYGIYANRFGAYAVQSPLWEKHYTFIETVFRYLSLKCEIAQHLIPAYLAGDKQTLSMISDIQLSQLLKLEQQCHTHHKALWLETYKPFGWEVLDQRYGGTAARIRTAQERINSYINGSIDRLEELDESRLPMTVSPWNPFSRIVTGTVKI